MHVLKEDSQLCQLKWNLFHFLFSQSRRDKGRVDFYTSHLASETAAASVEANTPLLSRDATESTCSDMNRNLHGLAEIPNTRWLALVAAEVTKS